MIKKILIATAICIMQSTNIKAQAVSFDGAYTGEVLSNLKGGIKKGTNYLGYIHLGMELNTEEAKLWQGGSLRFSAGNTHGGIPSARLVGDCQTVSNIEAGNHTFLSELWYKHSFGKLSVVGGLQDFNASYATSAFAENYVNSSLGLFSTMSAAFNPPTYPLTGLGLDLRYEFTPRFAIQTALFDGNIPDFEKNPYNLKWSLSPHHGYLWVAETQLTPTLSNERRGRYTIGGYHHTSNKGFGVYTTLAQTLWKYGEKSVNAFVQASYTQHTDNDNHAYVGGGVNATGIFCRKHSDWLGLAVAAAFFKEKRTETTLELSYKRSFKKHFYIQPDLQYVIHPAGTEEHLRNALVGIFRIGMEF